MQIGRFDNDQPVAALVPAITVAAFCEDPRSLQAITAAAADPRMMRAYVSSAPGGIAAAIAAYQDLKTPNVLIVETSRPSNEILPELATLAPVCDPDTHVIVVGRVNDVVLYRSLIQNGIAEYMVTPLDPLRLIDVITGIFETSGKRPGGRLVTFLSAKGGSGSSSIAQNTAWLIGQNYSTPAVLADFDAHFGTAALNFNVEASAGVAEALNDPERIDPAFLERLLTRVNDRLSLLAGSAPLERDLPQSQDGLEALILALRDLAPWVIADMPAGMTPVARTLLMLSDEVVITAAPELAALRNAKELNDHLVSLRPNDAPAKLVINMVGADKRVEIPPAEMAKALRLEVTAAIPYDPAGFSQAMSKGQMLAVAVPKSPAAKPLAVLASSLAAKRTQTAPEPPAQSILTRFKTLLKR